MNAEEKAKLDLVQEIADIRSGKREGPINARSVYPYINETPALLSLLYDIDYMPEQLEERSTKWCYMERIVCAWCSREMEIAEERKEIRAAQCEAIGHRALRVIEGLTFPDITNDPKEKLEEIYKYAHIGVGDCENPHEDWCEELLEAEEALVKMGII